MKSFLLSIFCVLVVSSCTTGIIVNLNTTVDEQMYAAIEKIRDRFAKLKKDDVIPQGILILPFSVFARSPDFRKIYDQEIGSFILNYPNRLTVSNEEYLNDVRRVVHAMGGNLGVGPGSYRVYKLSPKDLQKLKKLQEKNRQNQTD
ncbi:MAG: hypothetical protein J6Y94_07950 [Bacteriovoracaceae bacterium]|nr:hypothetical protein [Bacteriovoracaceae bacterium]